MRYRYLLGLFLLAPLLARADSLESPKMADKAVATFMQQADQGQVDQAYVGLHPYLGVDADAYNQAAKKAVSYFKEVFDKVGKPLGDLVVRREHIGNSFYRISVLQKYQSAAFEWQFTFYQPKQGWHLVGVSYSTDIDDLYQTLPGTR
ncbi:hypothetical protein [Mangrovitalea sediminis]|uniref:hypothetical protein n=1 Tax=Mangrovitalea sediminis TaxID=1982043 RepID=UPI000BE5977C|nr:hypothetical protein [Mangrovitalea sediminis]